MNAPSNLPRISALLACLALALPAAAQKDTAVDLKALLITGGCCHDYDTQRELIPAAIDSYSKLKVEWTIYHQRTDAGDRLLELYRHPGWADGYDVVVHNECFAKVGKGEEEFIEGILEPHRNGVPAVLVHCSMHCYREGENAGDWWEFCGVHSPRHGKRHPFEVRIKAPDHEVMKGMENWTTPQGELYFIDTAYPTMTPLAESASEADGALHANIWVNEYGPNKTRVFATTIGHHNETMLQAQYMEMLTRGFLWAAGKPVAPNLLQ